MKQIKAFVPQPGVSDLIHALNAAGFRRLSLFDVKGLLRALSARSSSIQSNWAIRSSVKCRWSCSARMTMWRGL